jgi:hypothetical protein
MSFELKGKLTDSSGHPLSNYTIKAFDDDFIFDDPLGTSVTLDDGSFKFRYWWRNLKGIHPTLTIFATEGIFLLFRINSM